MPNDVVVSERLLSNIARRYIALQRSGKGTEADALVRRLKPTEEFYELLRKQIIIEVRKR